MEEKSTKLKYLLGEALQGWLDGLTSPESTHLRSRYRDLRELTSGFSDLRELKLTFEEGTSVADRVKQACEQRLGPGVDHSMFGMWRVPERNVTCCLVCQSIHVIKRRSDMVNKSMARHVTTNYHLKSLGKLLRVEWTCLNNVLMCPIEHCGVSFSGERQDNLDQHLRIFHSSDTGVRPSRVAPEPLNLTGGQNHGHAMSIASGSPLPSSPTEDTVDDDYDGSDDDSEDVPPRLEVHMRHHWQDLCQEFHGKQVRTGTSTCVPTDGLVAATDAHPATLTGDDQATCSESSATLTQNGLAGAALSDPTPLQPRKSYPTYLHPSKYVSSINVPSAHSKPNRGNAVER